MSRYSESELDFFKNVYIAAIRSGSISETALRKSIEAVRGLRTMKVDTKYTEDEINAIKANSSSSKKESSLDIIKSRINAK